MKSSTNQKSCTKEKESTFQMIGGSDPPLAFGAFQSIPLYVSVIPTMAKTTFPAIARDGLLHKV